MGNFKSLVLTFLVLLTLNLFHDANGARYGGSCAEEGQPCATDPDNMDDPLFCKNKVCQCYEDMFRHPTMKQCVSPGNGGECTLRAGEGRPAKRCTEFAQCYDYTTMGSLLMDDVVGSCYCDIDAVHDERSMQCKLTYGSNRCNAETDCDIANQLTCREGKCVCRNEDQVHDGEKCIALVGGTCVATPPFPAPKCGANMACNETTKQCECKEEFIPTPEKICGKPHGGSCDLDSECHPQFVCKAEGEEPKKCSCRDGQEYENGSQSCILLVGQSCNDTEGSLKCTVHASCTDSKCACDSGYKTGQNELSNKCVGLFDSNCAQTSCNTADYLQCGEDKKCGCIANYDRDDNARRCKGWIEENCRDSDDCVGNSVCSGGKCGCGTDQDSSGDKKSCVARHGATCNENVRCNEGKYLSCQDSTCQCKDLTKMMYDESNGVCRALANTECESAAEGITCVERAVCDSGTCRCLSGYVASEGLCVEGGSGADSAVQSSAALMIGTLGIMFFNKF